MRAALLPLLALCSPGAAGAVEVQGIEACPEVPHPATGWSGRTPPGRKTRP